MGLFWLYMLPGLRKHNNKVHVSADGAAAVAGSFVWQPSFGVNSLDG
jgi:hypothetical protein